MENNHLTVKIVIIIVVAALVIGGLILYFKKYLTDNIMDGGDMRNPDYVACEEEIRTAMDNVEEINYTSNLNTTSNHKSQPIEYPIASLNPKRKACLISSRRVLHAGNL